MDIQGTGLKTPEALQVGLSEYFSFGLSFSFSFFFFVSFFLRFSYSLLDCFLNQRELAWFHDRSAGAFRFSFPTLAFPLPLPFPRPSTLRVLPFTPVALHPMVSHLVIHILSPVVCLRSTNPSPTPPLGSAGCHSRLSTSRWTIFD